jgi:hypothetical protein
LRYSRARAIPRASARAVDEETSFSAKRPELLQYYYRVTTFCIQTVLLQDGSEDRFKLGKRSRTDNEPVPVRGRRVVDEIVGAVFAAAIIEEPRYPCSGRP